MPLPIQFDWTEDESSLAFVLHTRGVKAKAVDVLLTDIYVKVNCPPSLFEVDLLHEIDTEHPKTRCRVGADKVTVTLRKKEPGIWGEFRAEGSRTELRARRQDALTAAAAREQDRLKKRSDHKEQMLKLGEHEQWRKDRENVEQIEKWEKEEKEKWEKDIFGAFDEDTGVIATPEEDCAENTTRPEDFADPALDTVEPDAEPDEQSGGPALEVVREGPTAFEIAHEETLRKIRAEKDAGAIWTKEELDETEEYLPDVRATPGKVGLPFTARARAGVPTRDRGRQAPPFPRDAPKNDHAPPMLAGDDFEDQSDPVWLKDKADSLMTGGDYQGAYHAYTAALVLAANARCFANRAVAALYLGLLEQCLEDCNSSVRILDLRCRAPPGQMPTPADPLDQKVRVRVEVRMGTAYLWLGAFGKAEAHFQKALDADDGLDLEERKLVKADLERICQAKAALGPKERADAAARRCVGSNENEATETALSLYEEAAAAADDESAVVHANRCFARLKAGQLRECLEDADAALGLLRRWPTAQRAPKAPARPTRLDPPYLDDPTFKHPDQAKQNEVDWLMKHNGGSTKDLPGLPPEYEWVKDAAEKGDTAWIAVRRKMPKIVIDAIRQTTGHLQDAMYTRQPILIRQQVVVAIDQNKGGEGPSYKAIKQAEEYATKLEEHDKEREADREKEEADARQEAAEFDLEENLAPRRVGLGQAGFGHGHPLSRTRRRLFVKVLLRRARACELLGQLEESAANLRSVLKVEPESPEAKQRLAVFSALSQSSPSASSSPTIGAEVRIEAPNSELPVLGPSGPPSDTTAQVSADAGAGGDSEGKKKDRASHGQDELDDDDAEVQGVDHASTTALLASAAEYMRKNDYPSALQIYHYARNTCKSWESPLVELKVLSNTSLCLQRIRGRLPDLISACNDTLDRIADLRYDGDARVSEEMLLRMECAALSRRGSAYAQQGKTEQSTEDAARVKELLARVAEIEATNSTGGNTAK